MEKICYEDRILGAIYYCLSRANIKYLFQVTEASGEFPYTTSGSRVDYGANFKGDWDKHSDKILRLATREEIEVFLERAEEGNYTPLPIPNYNFSPEIY